VTVSAGRRSVALAIDGVAGVREIDNAALDQVPPLVRDAATGMIEQVGSLDSGLLMVLRAGRIVDEGPYAADRQGGEG
jgi:chemotaxis signal transduction protein